MLVLMSVLRSRLLAIIKHPTFIPDLIKIIIGGLIVCLFRYLQNL